MARQLKITVDATGGLCNLVQMSATETAVKVRPILFKGEMVRAILDGRKTQTRRIIKRQPLAPPTGPNFDGAWSWTIDPVTHYFACPQGQPGDRLWVKETFYDSRHESKRTPWTYRSSTSIDEDLSRDFAWTPSIFMPRSASRLTLEIVSVRVERLCAISHEDAKAEGVTIPKDGEWGKLALTWDDFRGLYKLLWESINGKGSWAANPWVWVIEFKRL